MSVFKRFISTFFICITVLMLSAAALRAQPEGKVNYTTVTWPRIEVNYSMFCNDVAVVYPARWNYRLHESGKEIQNFTVWCYDTTGPCRVSATLVIAASSTMFGGPRQSAQEGAKAFIDRMNDRIDEAGVLFFNSAVNLAQPMTTDKSLLRSAIDSMGAFGATALLDGAYAGLLEVGENGKNTCRAMILLADRVDDRSTRTLAEVVELAQRYHVRVYSIAFGWEDIPDIELLSRLTGGQFFRVNNPAPRPSETVFQEIYDLMRNPPRNCILSYTSECPDGGQREVDVEVAEFCGGVDTLRATYRAPMDSSSFLSVHMAMQDAVGAGNSEVRVPVRLVTPIGGKQVHPFNARLFFNPQRIVLQRVEAPTGALYAGAVFTVTPLPSGAIIATNDSRALNAPGLLFNLVFLTSALDTGCADIRGGAAAFAGGCMIPILNTARICVSTTGPMVECSMDVLPTLQWKKDDDTYEPESFHVRTHFVNRSYVEARFAVVYIDYSPEDIILLAPTGASIFPTAPIPPQGSVTITWLVKAKPQSRSKNMQVCVIGGFEDHRDVSCCGALFLPQATSRLRCTVSAPGILVDTAARGYDPMPFPVLLDVENTGEAGTQSVYATIELPAGLELAGPDAPSAYTKTLAPEHIAPKSSAQIAWMVQRPHSTEAASYTIRVHAYTANADTTTCSTDVIIPELPEIFAIALEVEGDLVFCEGGQVELDAGGPYERYRWNSGHDERRLIVNTSGDYYCMVWTSDGRIGVSNTVSVIVHPLPDMPEITRDGDVLAAPPAAAYQWYRDGVELPNAVSRTLALPGTGSYRVRVSNDEGCTALSESFDVDILSVAHPASRIRSFDLWPEPNSGRFRVALHTDGAVQSSVVIRDLLGQEVVRYESAGMTTSYMQDIDLGDAPAGVYILQVNSGGEIRLRTIIRGFR
jgi:hypothetical protein